MKIPFIILTSGYGIITFSIEEVPKIYYIFKEPDFEVIVRDNTNNGEIFANDVCYLLTFRVHNLSSIATDSKQIKILQKNKPNIIINNEDYLIESIPAKSLSPSYDFNYCPAHSGLDTIYFKFSSLSDSAHIITKYAIMHIQ